MIITTPRLVLVPLSPELIAVQLDRQPRFFSMLSAAPRADWPPPHYDSRALQWTLGRILHGEDPRWHTRIVATRRPPSGLARVLGVAGFKGPPDAEGEVEIAYSIVASEQRRGVGTEAVTALLGYAMGHEAVRLVSAYTLLNEAEASRRMLERAGFKGPISTDEPDVVRYELRRDAAPSGLGPTGRWVFRDLTRR